MFDFGKYNPIELYHSCMNDQWVATEAMQNLNFLNTYTFTKCVCEQLLKQNNTNQILCIVRPPIVSPSWVSPYPGYGGDQPSTLSAQMCLYAANLLRIGNMSDEPFTVAPVDFVSHIILRNLLIDESNITNCVWNSECVNSLLSVRELSFKFLDFRKLILGLSNTNIFIQDYFSDIVNKYPKL